MKIVAIIFALGETLAVGMYVVVKLERNSKLNKFKND